MYFCSDTLILVSLFVFFFNGNTQGQKLYALSKWIWEITLLSFPEHKWCWISSSSIFLHLLLFPEMAPRWTSLHTRVHLLACHRSHLHFLFSACQFPHAHTRASVLVRKYCCLQLFASEVFPWYSLCDFSSGNVVVAAKDVC